MLLCAAFAVVLTSCGGGGGQSAGQSVIPAGSDSTVASQGASTAVITATGTIAKVSASAFVLQTGPPHGYVDVYTNAATTYTGVKPAVGEIVTVTGTGSYATSITASNVAQAATAALASPVPVTSASPASPISVPALVVAQGPVVALKSGAIEIQAAIHGYNWIAMPATAIAIDGPAVVGKYAVIGGTGSFSSGITAVAVTYSAAAPTQTTLSGTVASAEPYGFTLDVSSAYPAVPIVVSSTTVIAGGTLERGAQATVTGYGSSGTSLLGTSAVIVDPTPQAVATATPGPIAQTHVLNADYLGGHYGTREVAWSTAAAYLTWAQTTSTDASAISAAGIKTQLYTDPNRIQSNDPLFSSPEDAFAHDCSGNRVTDYFDSVTQYVANPASADLQASYAAKTTVEIGSAHFDAIYQDDNGPLSDYGYAFSPSLPCSYTDSAWIAGGQALDNAAPRPVVVNGLSGLSGHNPSPTIALLTSSNTIGGNFEGCYAYNGDPENSGWLWAAEENTELQVNAMNKMFWCQERYTGDASQNVTSRIYAYASFLLTYNPSLDVLWEDYSTPSAFHVFPEEKLVVKDPVVATPVSVSGLLQTGGAYGRAYNQCFIAGAFVGPCAVAINSGASAVPFPFPQFKHTLSLSGYGVTDGGTMSAAGAAPPTTLAAQQAEIVFP